MKRPQRTVGFAQVDVFAAGFRQRGGEFGVAQGAEQRQHSAEDPDREDHERRADVACTMSLGTRKMPLPMTVPTTMAAALQMPKFALELHAAASGFRQVFGHSKILSRISETTQPVKNVAVVPISTYQVKAMCVHCLIVRS